MLSYITASIILFCSQEDTPRACQSYMISCMENIGYEFAESTEQDKSDLHILPYHLGLCEDMTKKIQEQ